ncbi:hypothetical protein AO381_0436 [Moraxella catarrhalis]|nr:hypothetical protein AO381_0436 [Moraxella catarrhalis]
MIAPLNTDPTQKDPMDINNNLKFNQSLLSIETTNKLILPVTCDAEIWVMPIKAVVFKIPAQNAKTTAPINTQVGITSPMIFINHHLLSKSAVTV